MYPRLISSIVGENKEKNTVVLVHGNGFVA